MSLLVVEGNIVAALPMKGWYICTYMYTLYNTLLPQPVGDRTHTTQYKLQRVKTVMGTSRSS